MPATRAVAPWYSGANMKQMSISLSAFSDTNGIADTFTPNAVSKSALPDLLLAARFPCFATGSPAPAITNAAVVEILKVFARLDPVPAVSMKHWCCERTRTARERRPSTMPVSSSTVSPFAANATSAPEICASVASGSSNASSNAKASSRLKSSRLTNRARNSVNEVSGIIREGLKFQEVSKQLLAVGRQNRLGMKLHTFHLQFTMTQTHYDIVCSRRGDLETLRQRFFFNDQRMVAAGEEMVVQTGKDRFSVMRNFREIGRASCRERV